MVLLETADGKRYALEGVTDFEDGKQVTVEGSLKAPEDSVGIGMTGDPVFTVMTRSSNL